MSNPPDGRDHPPASPDELNEGIRGRVRGVTRIGPRAIGLAFLLVLGLVLVILYGINKGSPTSSTQALATPPPAIPSDEPHFGSNVPIVATPEPATPPPALVLPAEKVPNVAAAPAAPVRAAQSDAAAAAEQRRIADEAARRQEDQKRQDLIASAQRAPILTGGAGGGSSTQLAFAGNGENTGGVAAAAAAAQNLASLGSAGAGRRPEATPPPTFLDGPTGQYRQVNAANVSLPEGGNPKDFLQAQRFAPLSPFEITASSVIPAALITGIDSEQPGLITAQVREDVYDTKTGHYMLIPRGSRLVGLYKSDVQYGQSRVLVAWQRLIFPDTTSIDLMDMSGADVQGGAGLGGEVDNHYGRIFGAALLTSILAAGVQLSQPQQSNVFNAPSAGQALGQAIGQQVAQVGTQIVSKSLSIPPTIHVAKGYPFLVVVDRDIVLPGPYQGQ
jgi:type IV secretory pathway VirB10-like protein